MRSGVWVLNIMAFVWCLAGVLVGGDPAWWPVLPALVSVALLLWEQRALAGVVPQQSGGRHVGRVVAIWIAFEAVAIVVTANVLVNLHRVDAVMPAIAIIVGIHFLGLAKGIPLRLYYATGAGLIAVGGVALIAPPWHLPLATGAMTAVTFWISGIALARQAR